MSAIVLNRKYELQLPNSFINVEKEEMEYIDGGYSAVYKWWGRGVRLSGSETAKFISGYSYARDVIIGACGALSVVAGILAAVTTSMYSNYISKCNSNNSGVTLMWTYAQLAAPGIAPYPVILDNY